ncbi:MAG: APC family permease [Planctomycetota bacterium]
MTQPATLRRELGVFAASGLGLGSILGTGVFVGLGLVAGVAGAGVLPAVLLAGLLAVANGLSSTQLAAAHPVAGGTYEYGYRLLSPWVGFTAGSAFLLAKSASAATAALAIAGHVLTASGIEDGVGVRIAVGLLVLAVTGRIAAAGVRLGAVVNGVLVGFTALVLLAVSVVALSSGRVGMADPAAFELMTPQNLLHGTALAFVAFTGYGRIATLGEEVREPRRTIPRAIGTALFVSFALYALVAAGALKALGPTEFHDATVRNGAPLEVVVEAAGWPVLRYAVAAAALTAMAAVLLNLQLGLSRVALAMARRGDLPAGLAHIDAVTSSPARATWAVTALIAGITGLGSVSMAWSFSAFTVLVYYGITNLAALRLGPADRFAPRAVSWLGLGGCALIAIFVEPRIAAAGIATLVALLTLRTLLRKRG